jgi:large subunit ribosomal protein L18
MGKLNVIRYGKSIEKRVVRTRARLAANPELPRLSVFRSNKFVYAQVLDQKSGKTLAGVKAKKGEDAGERVAKKLVELKIKKVVFDRSGYMYHGQVKAVAEAARKAGLEI